jgi:hypothetical protein
LSNDTTLLFRLAGVRVERVVLLPGGIREVHVQTADEAASGCPSCGVLSSSTKGQVATAPRDIPYGTGPVAVVWHKRRWRCREPLCERQTFTETIPELPSGARTTRRLRAAIGVAIGDANRAVSEVAAGFGVSWPTAHAAFVEVADRALAVSAPTRVLGIDETRRGKPRWDQHPPTGKWGLVDRWHSGFVDLDGHPTARLIGKRPPIDADWDEALAACARTGTALEINSFPDRLDLSDMLITRARQRGEKFAIDTDAHAEVHLGFLRYGVGTAQRGWVTSDDVINTWPLKRLRGFLHHKR